MEDPEYVESSITYLNGLLKDLVVKPLKLSIIVINSKLNSGSLNKLPSENNSRKNFQDFHNSKTITFNYDGNPGPAIGTPQNFM